MRGKWKHGLNWWVRCTDNKPLNLNTEAGADMFLGLCETIKSLEGRLHRREVRATKKRKSRPYGEDEEGD